MAIAPSLSWSALLWMGVRRSPLIPCVVGIVLLAAAFLKAYALATESLPEKSLLTSRSLLLPLTLFEFALGLWLLSGLHARLARYVVMFLFFTFLEIALYQALADERSCGCLGKLSVHPWIMVFVDSICLLLLVIWHPPRNGATIWSHRWRLVTVVAVFILFSVPGTTHMVYYIPAGVTHYLRQDPRLQRSINLSVRNATKQEVLQAIGKATGLDLTADGKVFDTRPRVGTVELHGVPAWAAMEFLAQDQAVPARWVVRENGYELVTVVPLGNDAVPTLLGVVVCALWVGAMLLSGYIPRRGSARAA